MSALLDKAIEQARRLPPDQQDALAAMVLAEIADEVRWDNTFADSQDALERMANRADEEDRRGWTKPLDPDDL
ncbi:MAG: hypothetical protein F4Y01_16080 [Gammaproteobacteria bacterium]|nr:hypothetical protein [Gammaproteobacteria bacterium]